MSPGDPIVLAFFPDHAEARHALRDVRRYGLRHSISIQRTADHPASVEGHRYPHWMRGGTLLVTIGALLAVVLVMPVWETPADNALIAIIAFTVLSLGATLAVWLGLGIGVAQDIVSQYTPWVLPGESLLILTTRSDQLEEIRAVLGRREYQQGSVFIMEPEVVVPEPVSHPIRQGRLPEDQLTRHAQELASVQVSVPRSEHLWSVKQRITDAARTIDVVTSRLLESAQAQQSVSTSAEWLLDNNYLIQQHVLDVERALAQPSRDEFPTFQDGRHAGAPRIYALASDFVGLTDGEVIEEEIFLYLQRFQTGQTLAMAEIWQFPLMLRVGLLELVAERAIEIGHREHDHEYADFWASRLLSAARLDPDELAFALAQLAREEPDPSTYVVDRLINQTEAEPLAFDAVRTWLEHKTGVPIAEVIEEDQRHTAYDLVTLANAITSLRHVTSLDWAAMFERLSVVERLFRDDPSGIYPEMDFLTRDWYRKELKLLAAGARISEQDAARAVVELAQEHAGDELAGHIGLYLVDDGRPVLERRIGARVPTRQRLVREVRRHANVAVPASILLSTLAILVALAPFLSLPDRSFAHVAAAIAWTGALVILASEAAVQLVSLTVTRSLPTQPLPKLSFKTTIPSNFRTLVVTPEVLGSAEAVRASLDRMETRYLANRDPNLLFGLIMDLPDAPHQTMPGDAVVLDAAEQRIAELNCQHDGAPFLLFFRERRWSDTEGTWLGWERKRGKLEELNRLLTRGSAMDAGGDAAPDGTLRLLGDPRRLEGIRFVITLDADTILPRDVAKHLIATLGHPLNLPRLGPDGRSIKRGYGIIQPRIVATLPSASSSRFSRIFADCVGVDPYSRLVSDLYQDLAGDASYYGKGIYDPIALNAVLDSRFPQGSILSHDLLEGTYTRVGLASDIRLFDQFPESWPVFARRQHRWIRGDWQIAAWCTPRVPSTAGWERNPLSPIDRWKIFDNLRRSLIPISAIVALFTAWTVFPESAMAMSVFVAGIVLFPALLGTITSLIAQPQLLAVWNHQARWLDLGLIWARELVALALIPHDAVLASDAIARVVYRRLISRRHLLEWQPSRVREGITWLEHTTAITRLATLHAAFAIALIAATLATPSIAAATTPYLVAWIGAPFLMPWLDGSARRPVTFTVRETRRLRAFARLTWRYFDDFVGSDTSFLPPDNFQQIVRTDLAQRTSPTNMGLWLTSALTAYDFGFITIEQLVERLEATFHTLSRLERYEGHILNWYDTKTLQPLYPRYVSTVDSGNLVASLWVAAEGLSDAIGKPIIGQDCIEACQDSLYLLDQAVLRELEPKDTNGRIDELLATLKSLCETVPARPEGLIARLGEMQILAAELADLIEPLEASRTDSFHQLQLPLLPLGGEEGPPRLAAYWSRKLADQSHAWCRVVDRYLLSNGDTSSPVQEAGATKPTVAATTIPSLRDLACVGGKAGTLPSDSSASAMSLILRVEALVVQCRQLADEMRMGFLFDEDRKLFSIGFNVETRQLDTSYYDLLASEARIASYVAIAQGDVPADHWLALGRMYARVGRRRALLSWSGTMFEYLMPTMYMRTFRCSLLDDAERQAIRAQMDYAERIKVPWGISESAFSALDQHHIYQYKAFGVPGLGARRALADDLVVAPYATALALPLFPQLALRNMKRLADLGMVGEYGFYDAIDFTPRRQPQGTHGLIAYTFMAHHQAMTLVSIGNALHENVMVRRFHADGRVRSGEPMLWERIPAEPPLIERPLPVQPLQMLPPGTGLVPPTRITTPDTPIPRTQLLGSEAYSVMVTNAGGGYSRWRDVDLTRWRADATTDEWGSFIYVKDTTSGAVWSPSHQPTRRDTAPYSVTFTPPQVTFERRDADIGTTMEIAVSVEDAAELRRLTFTNYSDHSRSLGITSYVELALAPHAADVAHPAFSKLFVKTEALPDRNALFASRRPRSAEEGAVWAAHAVSAEGATLSSRRQFETDRARFIGRGRTLEHPAALDGPLSNTAGWVLDPIFSLRYQLTVEPGKQAQLVFVTCAGESRTDVLAMIEKYRDIHIANRAFGLTRALIELEPRKLRIPVNQVQQFQQLATHMIFPNRTLRASQKRIRDNRLGQSRLWAYGISGDLPILLVTIGRSRDLPLVREALAAHAYWRLRGFRSDLVILNEEAHGYHQPLEVELNQMIQWYEQFTPRDQPAGIYLRVRDQMPEDDARLLHAVARVVLVASRGSLERQLAAWDVVPAISAAHKPKKPSVIERQPSLPILDRHYLNGFGGFTLDGREYVVQIDPEPPPPAPWVNVIAGPRFGTLVSETGAGFTWAINSQGNRLSPWSNDPVSDPPGDAVYIRDDDSGDIWTPTAAPIREAGPYRVRHGQGYTVFEHNSHGIEQEMTTFVPMDASGGLPVRIQRLKLRNRSHRLRHLSIYGYNEWVLGTQREQTGMHVVTKWKGDHDVLFARNAYHPDVGGHVAFASVSPRASGFTADRTEFIGRNGTLARPSALRRMSLGKRVGAGLDPCAVLQTAIVLNPGETQEVIFTLGEAFDEPSAIDVIQRCRTSRHVRDALDGTRAWWDSTLRAIQVETPDHAADIMINRWLLYQTLSCRLWGRSGFYQSGGAFGFRDQLQDSVALLYSHPDEARALILQAASRQFGEGDVQHWWHPESGAGVRTRISDDLLWLPYVTTQYVQVTDDRDILEAMIPFLSGPKLGAGDHERYFVPDVSPEVATLAEHCYRAIARGQTAGPHGLPLIGTGDWNDGMSSVGIDGAGESVWLAWFLIDVLNGFAGLSDGRGEHALADRYRREASRLAAAVEAGAWDGAWYLRAFFDEGTPVGSSESSQDRIDSLAQSWAVISGAADPERAKSAMRAVDDQLILDPEQMVLLFTPPFEQADPDPGYISNYPPGVRENGGQYTHAAIWVAMAFARLGDGDRAAAILHMLNPIEHGRTREDVNRYKVEPYVVAADVYALEHQFGRGGWTWYTGSSGWMYRVWIEEILGFRLRGSSLTIDPVIPRSWDGFKLTFRYGSTRYAIRVESPAPVNRGVRSVELDGQRVPDSTITLVDDEGEHAVTVVLGIPDAVVSA